MSYEFYKILHVLSVVFVFICMAAYIYSGKKSFSIGHGVGLLIILVSGFGLLARLGLVQGFPSWVWVKLGVWLVVGAVFAIAKRKLLPPFAQILLWLGLLFVAAFSAITKTQYW